MPETASSRNLYSLRERRKVRLRVRYLGEIDRMVLRTDLDWDKDVLPCTIDRDASFAEFEVELAHPFLYLKPCLRNSSGVRWAVGPNRLVVATLEEIPDVYPSFYDAEEGSITDVITLPSKILNRQHSLRVYLPPGYNENTCRTFPVMYMQDGRNLFFPDEAFMGQDWGVKDKLALLNGMTAIQQMMIVGIFSADRMQEYTSPGYENYGRSIVEEVKPYIDAHFRTRPEARATGVMGSSLGGVVSFYMGWQWPNVFGNVGSLSGTFTHKDNLVERVLHEQRRDVRFYIDTGWPGDNYEVGLAMAIALAQRGYRYGHDFLYFAYPNAEHSERDWGQRLHLPFQFFAGQPAVNSRLLEAAMARASH
ncbi:MAG TPA: alpha/beta hydrolase-fold protein [Terriglobales bacterium]|nr:alpha/beta hydrolase-fold protein [Terriglobales bacterium]